MIEGNWTTRTPEPLRILQKAAAKHGDTDPFVHQALMAVQHGADPAEVIARLVQALADERSRLAQLAADMKAREAPILKRIQKA